MISMAELAERAGVDIWRFQTEDGRSIKAAIGYLTPYLEEGRKWPHGQAGSGSVRRGATEQPTSPRDARARPRFV